MGRLIRVTTCLQPEDLVEGPVALVRLTTGEARLLLDAQLDGMPVDPEPTVAVLTGRDVLMVAASGFALGLWAAAAIYALARLVAL